ncbi:MAG: hypothetical protein IJ708_04735 [Clostridia bacterium]|nr:hypothetical protein [Clostridia bacterium]
MIVLNSSATKMIVMPAPLCSEAGFSFFMTTENTLEKKCKSGKRDRPGEQEDSVEGRIPNTDG